MLLYKIEEKLLYTFTTPKFWVCAQLISLEKRFNICHILHIRKPKVAFPFRATLFFSFSNECPGLGRQEKSWTRIE